MGETVDALMVPLSSPPHGLNVDDLRSHIEGLGAKAYDTMSYYKGRMATISATLIERGVISIDAIGRKREFSTEGVQNHDSTAERRYPVLPPRAYGSEALNETGLSALVTRDAMIGVTVPAAR